MFCLLTRVEMGSPCLFRTKGLEQGPTAPGSHPICDEKLSWKEVLTRTWTRRVRGFLGQAIASRQGQRLLGSLA